MSRISTVCNQSNNYESARPAIPLCNNWLFKNFLITHTSYILHNLHVRNIFLLTAFDIYLMMICVVKTLVYISILCYLLSTWSVHVDTDGYLMDEGPGVLLGDGGGEDGQDLVEVHTAVLVQGAGVPHVTSHGHAWLLHSLLPTAAGLVWWCQTMMKHWTIETDWTVLLCLVWQLPGAVLDLVLPLTGTNDKCPCTVCTVYSKYYAVHHSTVLYTTCHWLGQLLPIMS